MRWAKFQKKKTKMQNFTLHSSNIVNNRLQFNSYDSTYTFGSKHNFFDRVWWSFCRCSGADALAELVSNGKRNHPTDLPEDSEVVEVVEVVPSSRPMHHFRCSSQ